MGRRISRANGLREALTAQREKFLDRWPTGKPDARLAAMRAGEPLLLSSSDLLTLGGAAGVPIRDLSYGGRLRGATFVLDADDRLSVWDDDAEHQGDGTSP